MIKAIWERVRSYEPHLAEPLFVGRDRRRPLARLANHPVREQPCPAIFVRLNKPSDQRTARPAHRLRNQIYSGFVLSVAEGTFGAEADTDLFAEIRCADPSFLELFLEFSENLMRKLEQGTPPDQAVAEAIREWLCFFKRTGLQPLSAEALTGLYGELSLLRELLDSRDSRDSHGHAAELLQAWRGPYGENWDFHLPTTGALIEVKSTVRPRTEISVNGLDQLTTSCHMAAYLNFRMFDVFEHREPQSDLTLVSIREQVEERLRSSGGAGLVAEFFERLELVGYFPHHESHYRGMTFRLCDSRWHAVDKAFPALNRNALPAALRDRLVKVNYVLSLADLPQIPAPKL
jgi:hypothetical protein